MRRSRATADSRKVRVDPNSRGLSVGSSGRNPTRLGPPPGSCLFGEPIRADTPYGAPPVDLVLSADPGDFPTNLRHDRLGRGACGGECTGGRPGRYGGSDRAVPLQLRWYYPEGQRLAADRQASRVGPGWSSGTPPRRRGHRAQPSSPGGKIAARHRWPRSTQRSRRFTVSRHATPRAGRKREAGGRRRRAA